MKTVDLSQEGWRGHTRKAWQSWGPANDREGPRDVGQNLGQEGRGHWPSQRAAMPHQVPPTYEHGPQGHRHQGHATGQQALDQLITEPEREALA